MTKHCLRCGRLTGNAHTDWCDALTQMESENVYLRAEVERLKAAPTVTWLACTDAMPRSGQTVLAFYRNSHGNGRLIRAMWVAEYTLPAAEYDIGEYDEATDEYYDPQGWYECISNWDEYSHVTVCEGDVTLWAEMPAHPEEK